MYLFCNVIQYWSYYLTNVYVNQGTVIVQGINFGDPAWGALGAFGTGFIFYMTYEYARHAAYYVYETEDGQRLGFQMHTVLGYPGRKMK